MLLLLFCGVAGSNREGARGQVSEKKIWVALAVASLAMLAAARWTTALAVLKSFQCFTPTAKGIFCKSLVRIHAKPMGRAFSQQQIIFHRELCCLMSNIINGSVAFLLAWYFSFCWPLRCPCYWCCYHHCCYCWEHWQWCRFVFYLIRNLSIFKQLIFIWFLLCWLRCRATGPSHPYCSWMDLISDNQQLFCAWQPIPIRLATDDAFTCTEF